jgi:hypothetical protein
MGTEQDKTNVAVVATMLAIGAAAMVGGSAALVALARGEIRSHSEESQGFANLTTVHDLKASQHQRLDSAKLPITKAKAEVLATLARDPSAASPPAPQPTEPQPATTEGALGVAPDASGAPSGSAVPADGAAPTEGATPDGVAPGASGTAAERPAASAQGSSSNAAPVATP